MEEAILFSELANQALCERIIDAYLVSQSSVVVLRKEGRYEYSSEEEGRTFLHGLLLGCWAHVLDQPMSGLQQEQDTLGQAGPERPIPPSDEKGVLHEYVYRLIEMAKQMGIVKVADVKAAEEEVVLHIPEVSSVHRMSYVDAAELLSRCIADELRAYSEGGQNAPIRDA